MEVRAERFWTKAKGTHKQAAGEKLDQVAPSAIGSPGRVSRSSVINALPGVRENVGLPNEPIVMAESGPDIIGRADRFGPGTATNLSKTFSSRNRS
jgi:hypothetical protein